jgi:hypothetical protein
VRAFIDSKWRRVGDPMPRLSELSPARRKQVAIYIETLPEREEAVRRPASPHCDAEECYEDCKGWGRCEETL